MSRRVISVLIFGLVGAGLLVALGLWQLQRLAWKEAVLAEISARIEAAPVGLPDVFDRDADRYLPVRVEGRFAGDPVRVLVSMQGAGPGYRVITPFESAGQRIMVDRGFLAEGVAMPDAPDGEITLVGNLHWPDEVDGFTPAPDLGRNIWYARDVDALAAHLSAEPVLVIARELSVSDAPLTPLPVTIEGIPNNHLGYAIQWFGLALVWLGMTAFLLWRITRRSV
ncbi:SURF1 family protein [Gymnodinialimonas ceratoperidinii]|uniref:SURF1-like protein n=1 Tax=Gymnodinialimonas ceratoperidinii TaxID=2856823 RepID=A0A8F6YC80_9RHOB|nr:SURF1 family protein [Gymnodinialimonas ceratoperidinii]QXT40941.1 SURF1 family protein [Gymnodinialimonas ceratoperidinii]